MNLLERLWHWINPRPRPILTESEKLFHEGMNAVATKLALKEWERYGHATEMQRILALPKRPGDTIKIRRPSDFKPKENAMPMTNDDNLPGYAPPPFQDMSTQPAAQVPSVDLEAGAGQQPAPFPPPRTTTITGWLAIVPPGLDVERNGLHIYNHRDVDLYVNLETGATWVDGDVAYPTVASDDADTGQPLGATIEGLGYAPGITSMEGWRNTADLIDPPPAPLNEQGEPFEPEEVTEADAFNATMGAITFGPTYETTTSIRVSGAGEEGTVTYMLHGVELFSIPYREAIEGGFKSTSAFDDMISWAEEYVASKARRRDNASFHGDDRRMTALIQAVNSAGAGEASTEKILDRASAFLAFVEKKADNA